MGRSSGRTAGANAAPENPLDPFHLGANWLIRVVIVLHRRRAG
jgi:hypothetical protein